MGLPNTSEIWLALSDSERSADILGLQSNDVLKMNGVLVDVAQALDGDEAVVASNLPAVKRAVARACNLLERIGAVCRDPESDDHRRLLLTPLGADLLNDDDPAARIAEHL